MSRKSRTFPTDKDWLLEAGKRVDDRREETAHHLEDHVRDALETLHSLRCSEELCHPTCDFSLLIALYYEGLSFQETIDRYGWANKGSASYRLNKAKERLKEAILLQIGHNPYE